MLGPQDVATYERTGALFPLKVLSAAQTARFRARFEEIEQAEEGALTRFDSAHLFFPWAYELSTHPRILDAMEALLGPDLVIWGSLIANKPARSGFNFAWHQDSAFCKFLQPAPAATAWIALTDSTVENGCLKVLPGSHRRELAHAEIASDDNILLQKQEVAGPVDEALVEDVVLRPGEMSIQHMSLLHKSSANRSDAARIGFIIRFSTPAIGACPYPVMQVRGSAACPHLDLWPAPTGDDFRQGLRARQALVAKQNELAT